MATGGLDGSPDTTLAKYPESRILALGGNIRRTMYPTLGHSCWDAHWAEPDFLPYMNSTHKANPLIFFNRFEFCPDSAVTVKLGVTLGFADYEWQKDGTTIVTSVLNANGTRSTSNTSGGVVSLISAGGNEITVKAFGTYRMRFRRVRNGEWSEYSLQPAVISTKTITQTPPIQIIGYKQQGCSHT